MFSGGDVYRLVVVVVTATDMSPEHTKWVWDSGITWDSSFRSHHGSISQDGGNISLCCRWGQKELIANSQQTTDNTRICSALQVTMSRGRGLSTDKRARQGHSWHVICMVPALLLQFLLNRKCECLRVQVHMHV